MEMTKITDKIHAGLLKRFHTLCSIAGVTADQKRAIVESYGVDSSLNIPAMELLRVCNKLQEQIDGKEVAAMDRLRKRAIASIGGYLKASGQHSNINIIKAIACRATGHSSFNQIPVERLHNLYHTFLNKQKDIKTVDAMAQAMAFDKVTGSNDIVS